MNPNPWKLLLVLLLAGVASRAAAQWELDSGHSVINFLSVKNASIAEIHRFDALVGFINSEGEIQLAIDLDSVETAIPIRNERMRALLFNTAKFPTAKVSGRVEPALLAEVATGGSVTTEMPVTLSLHGVEKSITVPVTAFSEGGGGLHVYTTQPVLLQAADFGLDTGVEALRQVAGLNTISTAVPVTLNLRFTRGE